MLWEYPTVHDLAIEMMKIRNEDWNGYDNDEEIARLTMRHSQTGEEKVLEEIQELLEAPAENDRELEVLKTSSLDKNTPTAFMSTNYETYIMKSGEYLFVSTCTNHYWDMSSAVPQLENYNLDDFGPTITEHTDILDQVEQKLQYAVPFWWPRIDKIVKQESDGKKCDRCDSSWGGMGLVLVDGELKCPQCELGLGWL